MPFARECCVEVFDPGEVVIAVCVSELEEGCACGWVVEYGV